MKFDFLATATHWADHLRPIYFGLNPEERGAFGRFTRDGGVTITAGMSDYRRALRLRPGRPVILFEHGAGFSFGGRGRHSSYAGGPGRERAAMLPSVNRWVRDKNQEAYPDIPAPLVGSPKMDRLLKIRPGSETGLVCIAFHWDCKVAPETGWALDHYQKVLPRLGERFRSRIIGHGHPKAWMAIARAFRAARIPVEPKFEEVCRRAAVYVNDCSSTLYEFAALGRPVVVLNSPKYRRDVHHGLRFWDHADVGIQVEQPNELGDAIEEALRDPPAQRARREAAVQEVYPYLGQSVERTVAVLREWAESLNVPAQVPTAVGAR